MELRRRLEDNIKIDITEVMLMWGLDWTYSGIVVTSGWVLLRR